MKSFLVGAALLGLIIGLFSSAQLFADGSMPVKVGFQILPSQTLSINGGHSTEKSTVSTVQIPQPSLNDLNRGYIEQRNAVGLQVQSNIPWTVWVRTHDINMGQSFDGTYTKPISDFQIRTEGGHYITISSAGQVLMENGYGNYRFNVDYRTLFDKNTYSNGNYRIEVIYMISSH